MQYSTEVSTKKTPQFKVIPGKKMVKNHAGGYVFQVDKWERLNRFLILGSEKGTYYASQNKLTTENAQCVIDCIKEDGLKVAIAIRQITINNRAPKRDPAIFALALVCTHGDHETKRYAYNLIHEICKTGTQLFQFCQSIQDLRGWSRGLRKGVANYYVTKPFGSLGHQLVKYRQRNGWTHRDVLRLCHARPLDPGRGHLLRWAVGKEIPNEEKAPIIEGFEKIQALDKSEVTKAAYIISDYQLPREAVPTEFLKSKEVWEALLQEMPVIATLRNLGVMGSVGVINTAFDRGTQMAMERLDDALIRSSGVHPMQVLMALKVYEQGHGEKGKLSWNPVSTVLNKLNQAFYVAFNNVQPSNKNTLLALDVSGSMDGSKIAGSSLSAREASAAMAMVTLRTEPNYEIMGFTNGFTRFKIQKTLDLVSLIRQMQRLPFEGTDCAVPMIWATKNKVPVDTFVIYTDNETWAGRIHPKQALDQYRQTMGRDAKVVVVGMTSTGFTIADPDDRGMMDVVGFDTAVPELIRRFSVGEVKKEKAA